MDAFSGAADMNSRITDEHRDGRDQFEIDERLDAEAADFFQIRVTGNANDKNAEKQWRDNHLDEAKKNRAEQLQIDGDGGPVVAKLRAGEKADENPARQRTAGHALRRDEQNRKPAQERPHQRWQRQQTPATEPRRREGNRPG